MKDNIELGAVEDHDGILTIRGGGARRDWNGIHYKQGMSAKNVGTTKLSANIATIPPGGVAYAHIHVDFEVILYIIEGKVRHEFGDGCRKVLENEAGDFIYIKPGVPHEVFNMSDTEPVVAFVARSSADEWDNIIPYDRNSPTPIILERKCGVLKMRQSEIPNGIGMSGGQGQYEIRPRPPLTARRQREKPPLVP